ncbi:MAG TPA: HAD family hydrolase [Holophagaceae bacterium]|nr:HAD family hydrolase [Holophagaceae bacterium]
MTQHRPILETLEILRRRPASAPRPIAVYDLDSTLFCTGPRNLAILRAFAEIRPQLLPFAERLDAGDMGWNVVGDLEALGFQDRAVLAELRHFWRATFFTDRFVRLDSVYEGAPELVRAVQAAGCLTYYLTGRDEPGMREGTLHALEQGGFPLPDGGGVHLKLKPAWEMEDLAFKTAVFEELQALGEVVLAFENEPANANRFLRAFPGATVVLHTTIHAPDPEPLDPGVHRVDSLKVDGLQVD